MLPAGNRFALSADRCDSQPAKKKGEQKQTRISVAV